MVKLICLEVKTKTKTRTIKIVMTGNNSEWEHLKTSFHQFVEQVPPNWEIILFLKAIK